MATLIQICGFESGSSSTEGQTSSSGTITWNYSTNPRTGSYSLRVNPVTSAVGYVRLGEFSANGVSQNFTGTAQSTLYASFQFRVNAAPGANSEEIISVFNASSETRFTVRLDSARKLSVYNGTIGQTLVATGATVLSTSTWYRIEFVVNKGASGAYELKINGTSELSGTADFGTANFTGLNVGKYQNKNSQTVDFQYDDIGIAADGWIGQLAIKRAAPTANGTPAEWTSGTGSSDYTTVDEEAPNNADYIACSNAAATKAHNVTLQSSTTLGITGTVRALKAYTEIREPSFAGATATILRVRSGGSNADNGAENVVGVTRQRWRVQNTDPATSSAWTKSAYDSALVGVSESNAIAVRCHWLGAYVAYDNDTPEPSSSGGYKNLLLLGCG